MTTIFKNQYENTYLYQKKQGKEINNAIKKIKINNKKSN